MRRLHDGRDALEISGGHVRSGWETQSALEEIIRHCPANDRICCKHRLAMHGFPYGSRLDVVRVEPPEQLIAIRTEFRGRDEQRGQPACGTSPRCFRHE